MDYQTGSLIEEIKLGNKDCQNRLFGQYQSIILRIVRLRLSSELREKLRIQSMDIVQEVFTQAFQNLKKFEYRTEGSFRHWLSKLVENNIRDQISKVDAQKRKPIGGEVSLDEPIRTVSGTEIARGEQVPLEQTSITEHLVKKDRKKVVDTLLLKLDEGDREVIIQHEMEGQTFKEIGQLLNKTEDAVHKKFERAMNKLVVLVENAPVFREYAGI